jgi:hypothetical protein
MTNAYRIFTTKHVRGHLANMGTDGRILQLALEKNVVKLLTGLNCL